MSCRRFISQISAWAALLMVAACATSIDPNRYRLAESGSGWSVAGNDPVLEDLRPRYAEFFDVIFDPTKSHLPNLLGVRDDLERKPVDRRNFDALNAVAIAYYETNARAEEARDGGISYLGLSQRPAKLLAVPWRAYGEIESAALRNAILDFFEDVSRGEKRSSAATAARIVRIVASLERKEPLEGRRKRIRAIVQRLRSGAPRGSAGKPTGR